MSFSEIGDQDWTSYVRALLDELRRLSGASTDGGVTRPSYSTLETLAMGVIKREATKHGLGSYNDPAANLAIVLPGSDRSLPEVWCGSHLDSVPHGGNYDGAAGVIAGLASLIQMQNDGFRPKRTIKLVVFRGEESAWFGKCYVGSSMLFGKLSDDDLFRKRSGESPVVLGDAIKSCDGDPLKVRSGRIVDPESIHAFLELHIEQGPDLDARQLPVGIVTGIRGNVRHAKIVCRGEAGHSGTVPMPLRHDAVVATSRLISRLHELTYYFAIQEKDVVMTVGTMQTNPETHAISRIPDEVAFCLEYRSYDPGVLAEFSGVVAEHAKIVEKELGVRFEFDAPTMTPPAKMDVRVTKSIKSVAKKLKLEERLMPSGAGHDAAVFAGEGVPTGMIFVRNQHGSHNPKEDMQIEDFAAGTKVLDAVLRKLASET